jgi:hypothetical protein
MANGDSPLVQRRRLRTELKRARQASGRTQEQAAAEMDWPLSKLLRIEAASSVIRANELKGLLSLYEVTDPERVSSLLALARAVGERSWWSAYRGVAPQSLLQLIEYETAAHVVRQFETTFIPGILQTEDYAHAVIENYYGERPGSNKVRALAELRVWREDLFNSDNSPSFLFVVDETAVRRLVGGSSIMRRQLRRLIEIAERPNITVAVIPFAAGLHPGMKGSFEIIEFADPVDTDIVYLESPRGDIFSDDPEETLRYREAFEELGRSSLHPRNSVARLAAIADEMS